MRGLVLWEGNLNLAPGSLSTGSPAGRTLVLKGQETAQCTVRPT